MRKQQEALGEAESGVRNAVWGRGGGSAVSHEQEPAEEEQAGAGILHSDTALKRQPKSHFITTSN